MVYANSARALCNEAVGCVMHMSRTLEIAFAKPEVAQQWVWIVDFNGFTMKQVRSPPRRDLLRVMLRIRDCESDYSLILPLGP